jgi:hypothetical protein
LNKYRIFETERFQKDLQHIAMSGQRKLDQKLQEFVYPQLRSHPQFGLNIKKLISVADCLPALSPFALSLNSY